MIDLFSQYGKRYKVALDESWGFEKPEFKSADEKFWYWEIWGRRGWCYNQNPTALALEINRSLWPKFERNPPFPYVLKRGGSDTVKVLIDEPYADKAVHWLVPHRRRVMSEAQRLAASKRLEAYKFKKRDSLG